MPRISRKLVLAIIAASTVLIFLLFSPLRSNDAESFTLSDVLDKMPVVDQSLLSGPAIALPLDNQTAK